MIHTFYSVEEAFKQFPRLKEKESLVVDLLSNINENTIKVDSAENADFICIGKEVIATIWNPATLHERWEWVV